jgi:predicted ATP-dependent endonuclease of OLD family
MKIKVKNLGVLKQAEFELGDLTIICGENNTGKTYATYALFGFLHTWSTQGILKIDPDKIKQLLEDGVTHIDINSYFQKAQEVIEEICRLYTEQLHIVFATHTKSFIDAQFQISLEIKNIFLNNELIRTFGSSHKQFFSLEKSRNSSDLVVVMLVDIKVPERTIEKIISDTLQDIIFSGFFPRTFITTSERTGIAMFYKEFKYESTNPINKFIRNNGHFEFSQVTKVSFFKEINYQPENIYHIKYPLPIQTNIDFVKEIEFKVKQSSFIAENYPDILDSFADIIGGKYSINDIDQLYYEPKDKRLKLAMDESSSAVRSLLDLGFYLRHEAQPGDLLMIDEPELNLHPENQRRVARLLARLVNLGIKVFITTHSDYIIKELNTLIMLNHDKTHLKRIAEVEGYQQTELLNADQIKVYIAEEAPVLLDGKTRKTKCQTLTPADIDPFMGIDARSFDKTIDTMNRIQSAIVWGED